MEDQREPAWLASLREQQLGEEPDTSQELQGEIDQADTTEYLRRHMGQPDMMEDLREQMIQAEEALEREEKPTVARFLLNLEPWQRLVLAVFLFL
ncbi:MAG: hypothetical protein GWN58_21820, partial [Anaerolineae bacterium]|nr:hypothetical protein [Anaerolineae bacterium]